MRPNLCVSFDITEVSPHYFISSIIQKWIMHALCTTQMEKPSPLATIMLPIVIVLLLSPHASYAAQATESVYETFVDCLRNYINSPNISNIVFAQTNSSYSSILRAYIRNARFNTTSSPKPLIIVAPVQESHVQTAVICAESIDMQIKTRSGGHDFEGLSYISDEPFIMLDMFNLRNITVDVQNEVAVVQAGATLGEVYYRIWEKSDVHGFPAGECHTVGVGGHFGGGSSILG